MIREVHISTIIDGANYFDHASQNTCLLKAKIPGEVLNPSQLLNGNQNFQVKVLIEINIYFVGV